jgi:hypothetical protein
MITQTIVHYDSCTHKYPEAGKEPPRTLTKIDLGGGETVYQCNDCGACSIHETRQKKGS